MESNEDYCNLKPPLACSTPKHSDPTEKPSTSKPPVISLPRLTPHNTRQISSTETKERTVDLQIETRTQTLGTFERQEHHQNKYKNWSLTPKKPILLLGASNLSHLPRIKNDKVQVVSYPGAKLEHAHHIIKNKTPTAPEVQQVILHFGLNNRNEGNLTILRKMVERVLCVYKPTL